MNDSSGDKKNWLMNAVIMIPLKSSCGRLTDLVNELFQEITPLIKVSSKSRQKEALKTILLNLHYAYNLDRPVRYSRDKNKYTRSRRYGMLFFKYDRLIPIIDSLEQLGYIEQSSYYNDPDDEYGLQTRMWSTKSLQERFYEHRLIQTFRLVLEPSKDEEIIVLRNKDKQEIGYRETHQTQQMRKDLERYNSCIDKHQITVKLTGDTIVDNRWLVENLYQNINNGKVWIQSVQLNSNHNKYNYIPPISTFTKHRKPFRRNPYSIIQKIQDIKYKEPKQTPISITHTKRDKCLRAVLLRRFWSEAHFFERDLEQRSLKVSRIPWDERKKVMKMEFRLRDIGVDELEFVLEHEHLHRIFNRQSWEHGGRAYGALHQSLPKEMRPCIRIDGQSTVELDYSAYHILMLYHMEGIDYPDDPYVVCEGPEMRDTYKAVALFAINAKNERKAYCAIYDELKSRGIPFPAGEKPIVRLVNRFKDAHPRIAKYICADKGIRLMNIDSRIMNSILVKLMDENILGLSVYDSVVVAEQHGDFVYNIMMEEYEKVMGFKPRIKCSISDFVPSQGQASRQ